MHEAGRRRAARAPSSAPSQAAPDAPEALRAGIHAFFAFLDADRDAWRVLHDESLPAGGEIAARVGEYRDADGGARHRRAAASARESRAVEPLSVAHLRRRRGARPLVAAHRRDCRAERTADLLIRTDRTRTEDDR